MRDISWLHLAVLILSVFRLTHLLVYDDIAAFIRTPFLAANDNDGTEQPRGSGLRHFIGSMLSCYWCTGIWCSIGITALYWFVPAAFPLLIILAVAGAAAIIESKL